MGFFNRLFYGASKRFANDVSNNVVRANSNAKDRELRLSIDRFNEVSNDFHKRKIFISDNIDLMHEIIDLIFEDDVEYEMLMADNKMIKYFSEMREKIEREGTPHIPQSISGEYSNMLRSYNEVIHYLEIFVEHRKWDNSDEKKSVEEERSTILSAKFRNLITEEEYKELLSNLKYVPCPLDIHETNIPDLVKLINQHVSDFINSGESILKMLEVK